MCWSLPVSLVFALAEAVGIMVGITLVCSRTFWMSTSKVREYCGVRASLCNPGQRPLCVSMVLHHSIGRHAHCRWRKTRRPRSTRV